MGRIRRFYAYQIRTFLFALAGLLPHAGDATAGVVHLGADLQSMIGGVSARISSFGISPDGQHVNFVAERNSSGPVSNNLYEVPIAGGAISQITYTSFDPQYDVLYFAYSPNGRLIYRRSTGLFSGDLFSDLPTGGQTYQLTYSNAARGDAIDYPIRFTPDGALAFYTEVPGPLSPFHLSRVATSGFDVSMRVNPNYLQPQGRSFLLGLTPDHQSVIFSSTLQNDYLDDIYSVPLLGGVPRQLNTTRGSYMGIHGPNATLSADGAVVLMRTPAGGSNDRLYAVPTSGSGEVPLTANLAADRVIGRSLISSDSRFAIYSANVGAANTYQLFSVPLAGGSPIPLSTAAHGKVETPTPNSANVNGRQMTAFITRPAPTNASIYLVPTDGSSDASLIASLPMAASESFDYYHLGFDPSAKYLTLYYNETSSSLRVYPLDGSQSFAIAGVTQFVFHPDGQHLLYSTPGDLFFLDLDAPGTAVRLSIDGERIKNSIGFKLSPDGTKAVYTRGTFLEAQLYAVDVPEPAFSIMAPLLIAMTRRRTRFALRNA